METLGRYELLRRLGIGGMAELFLARVKGIEGFEKLVALKRIRPDLAHDGELIRMFLDEARLAARLQHPNVGQVFDVGEEQGSYFFAMEFVDGVDVKQLLEAAAARHQVGLPVEHAVAIAIGAAAGLHHAHERRDADGRPLEIVHRDVSPSNIVVSWDGPVKLVDFGIAKARRRTTFTRAGTVKGKLSYMSPEQARGPAVDRRSDLFSLGVVLYELLTGVRPFDGGSGELVMARLQDEEAAPVSRLRPGCPPELERIVVQAMRKDPAERPETAQAMQVALEAYAREARLDCSSVSLAAYLREVFGQRERLTPATASPEGATEPEVVAARTASFRPSQPSARTSGTGAVTDTVFETLGPTEPALAATALAVPVAAAPTPVRIDQSRSPRPSQRLSEATEAAHATTPYVTVRPHARLRRLLIAVVLAIVAIAVGAAIVVVVARAGGDPAPPTPRRAEPLAPKTEPMQPEVHAEPAPPPSAPAVPGPVPGAVSAPSADEPLHGEAAAAAAPAHDEATTPTEATPAPAKAGAKAKRGTRTSPLLPEHEDLLRVRR